MDTFKANVNYFGRINIAMPICDLEFANDEMVHPPPLSPPQRGECTMLKIHYYVKERYLYREITQITPNCNVGGGHIEPRNAKFVRAPVFST